MIRLSIKVKMALKLKLSINQTKVSQKMQNPIKSIMQKCSNPSEINIFLKKHDESFKKNNKAFLIQFLNDFYSNNSLQRYGDLSQGYELLESNDDLTLYELTVKLSIYVKMIKTYKQREKLTKLISLTKQQISKKFKEQCKLKNLQKLQIPDRYLQALLELLTYDSKTDISQALTVLDANISQFSHLMKIYKIQYVMFRKLFHDLHLVQLRKFTKILYYLVDGLPFDPQIGFTEAAEFFYYLTKLKINYIGPRALPSNIQQLIFYTTKEHNLQKLMPYSLFKLFVAFKDFPKASLDKQSFMKIYNYLADNNLFFIKRIGILPYNKLNYQQTNMIYSKIMADQNKLWMESHQLFQRLYIRKHLMLNKDFMKLIQKKFIQNLANFNQLSQDDLEKFFLFGMVFYSQNSNRKIGQKRLGTILSSMYIQFINAKEKKIDKNQLINQNIVNILAKIKMSVLINILVILNNEKLTNQFQKIMKSFPSVIKIKKKDIQKYVEDVILVTELVTDDQNVYRVKQIQFILEVLLLDTALIRSNISSKIYLDKLSEPSKIDYEFLRSAQFKFDNIIHPKILFILIRKKHPKSDLYNIVPILLSKVSVYDEIILIQQFLAQEGKNSYQANIIFDFLVQKKRTNVRNMLILIGSLPFKLLKSSQGTFSMVGEKYFKNFELSIAISQLQMIKKNYLQNKQAYPLNSPQDFELDIRSAYYAIKTFQSFTYRKDLLKTGNNLMFYFLKNFKYKILNYFEYYDGYRFLQISYEIIAIQSLKFKNRYSYQIFQSYQTDQEIDKDEIFKGNNEFQVNQVTLISQNLHYLKKYYQTQLNKIQQKISARFYTLIKQFQIKCLLSQFVPYPQVQKEEQLSQLLQLLENENPKNSKTMQACLILMKLSLFGLLKLSQKHMEYQYKTLVGGIDCNRLPAGLIKHSLSNRYQYFVTNLKNIDYCQKYFIPMQKIVWSRELSLKNSSQNYLYYLNIFTAIKHSLPLQNQSKKDCIFIIKTIYRNFCGTFLKSYQIKEMMKLILNSRFQVQSVLDIIKEETQFNIGHFNNQLKDLLFFWLKSYYKVPNHHVKYIDKLAEEVKEQILKDHKLFLESVTDSQNYGNSKKFIGNLQKFLWSSIRLQLTNNQAFTRVLSIFIGNLQQKVKELNSNNILLNTYVKIYYYVVINNLLVQKQRDSKIQIIFQRYLLSQIESNSDLQKKLIAMKTKFMHKVKIMKKYEKNKLKGQKESSLGLFVDYYLPQTDEVIVVIKRQHYDIQKLVFNGELKFDQIFYQSCTGRKIKLFDPFFNEFVVGKDRPIIHQQIIRRGYMPR